MSQREGGEREQARRAMLEEMERTCSECGKVFPCDSADCPQLYKLRFKIADTSDAMRDSIREMDKAANCLRDLLAMLPHLRRPS